MSSYQMARNHDAAHVEIQIRYPNDFEWATVPGAWVFPTSHEANSAAYGTNAKHSSEWHFLRKDLTDENSVTAIQLEHVAITKNHRPAGSSLHYYQKEQKKLYGAQHKFHSFYPSYTVTKMDAVSHVSFLPRQHLENVHFAADSWVMSWSFLAKTYEKIQKLVENNELTFEIDGQCQFIIGRASPSPLPPQPSPSPSITHKNLIEEIHPPFVWDKKHWYRHKDGKTKCSRSAPKEKKRVEEDQKEEKKGYDSRHHLRSSNSGSGRSSGSGSRYSEFTFKDNFEDIDDEEWNNIMKNAQPQQLEVTAESPIVLD